MKLTLRQRAKPSAQVMPRRPLPAQKGQAQTPFRKPAKAARR